MNMKVYSFFAGAGFLDLGFEDAGFQIVYVNEFEEAFLSAYKYARKEMQYSTPAHGYFQGDINELRRGKQRKQLHNYIAADRKDSIVGFVGGPPCPDFSVAGKNKGIKGNNGRLTTSYKYLILQQMPDFFLFENVKGLTSTKKHKEEFKKIKLAFIRKGYVLTERLVCALEYGAPQDRYRIILIGVRSELLSTHYQDAKRIMSSFDWAETRKYSPEFIRKAQWPQKNEFCVDSKLDKPSDIVEDLTTEYWFIKNGVYVHPNSMDYFKPKALVRFKTIAEGDVSRKSFKRLHRWRYAPTSAYGNNEVHLHPYKERRLSVAEALAIQSLPSKFVIKPELTLTQKFKMVGNGVPYLVSYGIAEEIKRFFEEHLQTKDGEHVQ